MRLGLVTASGFGPINGSFAATFFSEFIWINLALMIFNLIPLAPLDGEKIADYFFPPSWARVLDTIRPYGPVILILLVVSGITSFIIMPPLNTLYYLLVG
jgi:Zn-dependent protease